MASKGCTYSVHQTAAMREVGGEFFIVTEDRSLHHIHTPTSVTLFAAMRGGGQTAADLATLLHERFEVSAETARDDVDRFLEDLVQRHIVVRSGSDEGAAATSIEGADHGV